MRNLLLTGFMATGKSTVGALVARKYGLQFVDTDDEVEKRSGRTVAELFSEQGEQYFRGLEREVLAEVLTRDSQVIATGGGTLLDPETTAMLSEDDRVVCLTCSVGEVVARTRDDKQRPLLTQSNRDSVQALLRAREGTYSRFEQVETTDIDAEQVADIVAKVAGVRRCCGYSIQYARESVIIFEHGAAASGASLMESLPRTGQVMVVTDTNVWDAGLVAPLLTAAREMGLDAGCVQLPAGEHSKNLVSLERLYKACMQRRLERGAVIVGIGGGMVCDIAALLAATYLRGVGLVLVPTTLLAQVDAGIGGKAAIDLAGAKNLIGAFYPADVVIIDPDTLVTLPRQQLSEGLAEVVKIAMMCSATLFELLEGLQEPEWIHAKSHIIRTAVMEKVRVVQQDPFENGVRALLNFGHTVGHASEAASGYALSHGDAVSVGMVAETWLAEWLGVSASSYVDVLRAVLTGLQLPTRTSCVNSEEAMLYMLQDKKRVAGELRFALPKAVGVGTVVNVKQSDARRALDFVLERTA